MSLEPIPAKLRDLAREAFAGRPADGEGQFALAVTRSPWRALDDALAAVVAEIEREIRAQVSAEIERHADYMTKTSPSTIFAHVSGLRKAAEIARGEA